MNTMTNLPTGITSLPEPCWHLVDPTTGNPADLGMDGIPHYDTEAEAENEIRDMIESKWVDEPQPPAMTARQLDHPCWIAEAACGAHIEGDEFMYNHHLDAQSALSEARACDWTVIRGVLRCDDGAACEAKS